MTSEPFEITFKDGAKASASPARFWTARIPTWDVNYWASSGNHTYKFVQGSRDKAIKALFDSRSSDAANAYFQRAIEAERELKAMRDASEFAAMPEAAKDAFTRLEYAKTAAKCREVSNDFYYTDGSRDQDRATIAHLSSAFEAARVSA